MGAIREAGWAQDLHQALAVAELGSPCAEGEF